MRLTKRQAQMIGQMVDIERQRVVAARDGKSLLNEEYLNGVSEWQLRQDTTDFVNNVRGRIKQFILLNKSENSLDQREAIEAMNDVCDELELKVYDVLESSLFNFTRRV